MKDTASNGTSAGTSQKVVTLAFLALDVGILRPETAEHPYHRHIQQMLGGMSGRKFVLVVSAELC